MKKTSSLLFFFLALSFSAIAQSVPQGMKYQAVARDLSGNVMAEKAITLKITLHSIQKEKDQVPYREVHQAITNSLGLFSLTVGEGRVESGQFDLIPWSTEDIWMEVSLKDDKLTDFITISDSRMLSVPYAFHAGSAEKLLGGDTRNQGNGVPANVWSLFGNSNVDSDDRIGVTNAADFIMITNNIERLRITSAGDVNIVNSLNVGNNVDIGNDIHVGNNAAIDNDLQVGGNTELDGTLGVDGITTLKNTTESTNKDNGALVVEGGAGIEKNVNIGGNTELDGTLGVDGITTLKNTTQSTTKDNGALVVEGGVGIEKNVNVGGNSGVTGNSAVGGTLGVNGVATFNNTAQSTTKDNGSVVVEGGLGVEKNINTGGSLRIVTAGTLNNGSPNTGMHVAHFENTANGSGIQIKVGAPVPHNNNNFITFLNSSGVTVGRIEGENGAADLANNREYQDDRNFMITDIAIASAAEAIAIAEEIQAGIDLAAAAASTTACVGLGVCATTPIPSLIASTVANLIVKSANLVVQSTNLAAVIANLVVFEDTHVALFGITFASGSEDYAEYLPKANPEDDFFPGEIVGVRHGFISRNTEGADRVMVISHNPAVLGGLPENGREGDYEMVAFMGQVPTRMVGNVEPGDYVLASGFHNGMGIAKHPSKMKPEDYKRILGVAWAGSQGKDLSMVNTAVGLNTNDLADLVISQGQQISAQKAEMAKLQSQIDRTHEILAELIPGFREAAGMEPSPAGIAPSQVADASTTEEIHFLHPGEGDIVYYEITNEELEAGFRRAEEIFRHAGIDMNEHPFWKRANTDAGYKEEIIDNVKTQLQTAVHTHKKINKEMDQMRSGK